MPKANISFLIYFLKKIHYYSFFKKCYKESLLNTFGILPNLFSKKKKIDDNHFLSLNISTKKKFLTKIFFILLEINHFKEISH